jgi:hypothetical protein
MELGSQELMLQEATIPILVIIIVTVLLALWIGKVVTGRRSDALSGRESVIPSGISVARQPLMTQTEASFYNLLRLAAEDTYLIFSQIPIWCLVEVTSTDSKTRQAFLNQIALKRVDFVLVHPGTLAVVKVVELEDPAQAHSQRQTRNRLIDEVLKMAGIQIVRVSSQQTASVPEMAALLDIDPID